MPGKAKIAFVMYGDPSFIHANVIKSLQNHFPGHEIEVTDLYSTTHLNRDPFIILRCLREYGTQILLGQKTLGGSLFRTPYAFDRLRQVVHQKLDGKKYSFTFQFNSIFDASQLGIPHFVYTDHTHLTNLSYPGFARRDLYSKAWIDREKEIYQHATVNFTYSTNVARSIREDYGIQQEKVRCVHCGFNAPVAKHVKLDKRRYSWKNILFVGRDWERKGGPTLLKAFTDVTNAQPKTTLTIVGCSPTLHLPGCRVIGKIPIEQIHQYYEQASVFCVPTTIEPFGIVFLEAMSYKLPIIGTNIGAQPDFIREGSNGYLVSPHQSGQLTERLIELTGSPEKCKTMGEASHRLVWEQYTWEKTSSRMKDEIQKHLE